MGQNNPIKNKQINQQTNKTKTKSEISGPEMNSKLLEDSKMFPSKDVLKADLFLEAREEAHT